MINRVMLKLALEGIVSVFPFCAKLKLNFFKSRLLFSYYVCVHGSKGTWLFWLNYCSYSLFILRLRFENRVLLKTVFEGVGSLAYSIGSKLVFAFSFYLVLLREQFIPENISYHNEIRQHILFLSVGYIKWKHLSSQ